MLCKKVSKLLSEFFDGVLDADMSVKVSHHLKQCVKCRKELDSLSVLHGRLRSVEKLQAPDYLYRLVQDRLAYRNKCSWYGQLKDALAYRWSRIRTTEVRFYWTRTLGTFMATVCFYFISLSIDPFSPGFNSQMPLRSSIFNEDRQELYVALGEKLGLSPCEQIKQGVTIRPEMDIESLRRIGEHLSEKGSDTTGNNDLAIVTNVDSSGTGKLDYVIDYPEDLDLLPGLYTAIASANYRPARMNGRSVTSPLVLLINNITVFNEK